MPAKINLKHTSDLQGSAARRGIRLAGLVEEDPLTWTDPEADGGCIIPARTDATQTSPSNDRKEYG